MSASGRISISQLALLWPKREIIWELPCKTLHIHDFRARKLLNLQVPCLACKLHIRRQAQLGCVGGGCIAPPMNADLQFLVCPSKWSQYAKGSVNRVSVRTPPPGIACWARFNRQAVETTGPTLCTAVGKGCDKDKSPRG